MSKSFIERLGGIFLIPLFAFSCSDNKNNSDAKLKTDIASDFYDQILLKGRFEKELGIEKQTIFIENEKAFYGDSKIEIKADSIKVTSLTKTKEGAYIVYLYHKDAFGGIAPWIGTPHMCFDHYCLTSNCSISPFVWKEGKIYTINEAYELSLFDVKQLNTNFEIPREDQYHSNKISSSVKEIDSLKQAKSLYLESLDRDDIDLSSIHINKHYLKSQDIAIFGFSIDGVGGQINDGKTNKITLGEKEYEFLGEWAPYVYKTSGDEKSLIGIEEAYNQSIINEEHLSKICSFEDGVSWSTAESWN